MVTLTLRTKRTIIGAHMGPTILVVDDDHGLTRLMRMLLEPQGYDVRTVENGASARDSLAESVPDLLLLDLMLPDADGLDICRQTRTAHPMLPIIVLSAAGDEQRKVQALDVGADDYLTKPFGRDELLARIRAVLRRVRPNEPHWAQEVIVVGDLRIDAVRRQVGMGVREIALTPTEYNLLYQLAVYPGRVLTHQMLLQEVWGEKYSAEVEYVHVYIGRLRRKLEPDPAKPAYLLTVPGVGYKMREP